MIETVAAIVDAHRAGTTTPAETVARTFARIRAHADPAVFISLRQEADALAEARALADKSLPLYGVPVAIKDNIDVAGLPTTAACPAFAYRPDRDAASVERLKRAGAIVIGKTNLDQFATGLVGVRSPYGIPGNPFDPNLSPGGSSSGSAVAVAAGLVPLALGTDTAGSGRVPAGLNNIVGLKPSLGLVSNAGVVPACRSLDCVSLFALTTDDAFAALAAIADPDRGQRCRWASSARCRRSCGLACRMRQVAFSLAIRVPRPRSRLRSNSSPPWAATVVEIDFAPFLETAKLLYEGPWVAERWAAVGDFIAAHPDDVHPVTRAIIETGMKPSCGRCVPRVLSPGRTARARVRVFQQVDVLMVPTAPAAYTIAEDRGRSGRLNSNLGTYTNFVNLLDLAGLAVPAVFARDGTPFGVTFLAPAGQDALLASIGRAFHAGTALPLGALREPMPPLAPFRAGAVPGEVALAVVGAHLSGMPLNGELRQRSARFLETTTTAPDYRLFALTGREAAEARPLGRCPRHRQRDRGRDMGAPLRGVSGASSRTYRRRSRSAPSRSPTAGRSRAFWSRPKRRRRARYFEVLAAGARSWRANRRKNCAPDQRVCVLLQMVARARTILTATRRRPRIPRRPS